MNEHRYDVTLGIHTVRIDCAGSTENVEIELADGPQILTPANYERALDWLQRGMLDVRSSRLMTALELAKEFSARFKKGLVK